MSTSPSTDESTVHRRTVRSLRAKDRWAGYGMLSPGLIVVGCITLFPILYSVWMSLNHIDLTETGFHFQFDGLSNYGVLLHSQKFWHSAWFTFYFALCTVVIEMVLGLMIAVAIQGVKYLKNISVVIMLIPWALITTVSAQMWGYIYNGVYGVMNYVLQLLYIIHAPVPWLSSTTSAVMAMMVADIWKTTPFVVIILVAGLQMIPIELYEAAYMDGANGWKVFWKVTFPLLRGSIALAGLFRILQAFGLFDLPFVLTNGGPGSSTESLAILGYRVMFNNLNFGDGAAVAVATVLFVLILSMVFLSGFKTLVTEGEGE